MATQTGRVYLSPPDVGSDERDSLLAAFDSGWIAPVGPDLTHFETEFAAIVGAPHAVALSSGTAGLHLALGELGVGRGDDVIVSTFTFAASANPIVYLGARPVFIDSETVSWNMSPQLLSEELHIRARSGRLPKAVVTVDLYGQVADYDAITAACAEFDVPIVEDAAEALGAEHVASDGTVRPAGSFGRYGVFSFNGNKIITTSGGGMVVSRDGDGIEHIRYLATQARQAASHYEHTDIGYNYRLSNLLAAMGRAQLRSLAAKIDRRSEINREYRRLLGGIRGIRFSPVAPFSRSNNWLTCIVVDPKEAGVDRHDIERALADQDIESRPLWKPMHMQPVFKGAEARVDGTSEALFADGLCIPSGSALTGHDQLRVVEVIRDTVG